MRKDSAYAMGYFCHQDITKSEVFCIWQSIIGWNSAGMNRKKWCILSFTNNESILRITKDRRLEKIGSEVIR